MLSNFIASRCARAGTVPLKVLLAAFRQTLPAAERASWTRSRFTVEIAQLGFPIAESHGVATIGGLSIAQTYKIENGRLLAS